MSMKEEITELVERIQSGERALLLELWKKVERLVAWYANKAIHKIPISAGVTFEDLYNSGYLALADAVERYERDGSFISLFVLCLKTSFAEASGSRNERCMHDPLKQMDTRSIYEPIPGVDDLTLADTIPANDALEAVEARIYNEQLHMALDRALDTLQLPQRTIVSEHYYSDKDFNAIAIDISLSVDEIRRLNQDALRRLRKHEITGTLIPYIEERTNYYQKVGVSEYQRTGSSAVEKMLIHRERMLEIINRNNQNITKR